MIWTLEGLKARTPDERWRIYKNAIDQPGHPQSAPTMKLIDDNKLSMRSGGGFPEEHPTIRAIYDICMSKAGVEAAVRATDAGLPGMAYVDPVLQAEVPGYSEPDTHSWAGEYVAQAMEGAGYKRTLRRKNLSKGCSAKSAMVFERKA